jgi:hypothetical protein
MRNWCRDYEYIKRRERGSADHVLLGTFAHLRHDISAAKVGWGIGRKYDS